MDSLGASSNLESSGKVVEELRRKRGADAESEKQLKHHRVGRGFGARVVVEEERRMRYLPV